MSLPTPYYSDDAVTIYHADCRDVLRELPKVDLVLTDPPYGVGFDYGNGYDDSLDGYIDRLWPTILSAESLVQGGGRVGVYQAAKYARRWAAWFPREWQLVALPKLFSQMYRGRDVQSCTDYLLWWQIEGDVVQRPHEYRGDCISRDFFVSTEVLLGRDPLLARHPCPRPLDQVTYLVGLLAPPQGIVLDPFLGSGTTAFAAKKLGRKCIGIEIEERYCEIAAKRCSQMVMALPIS